MPTKLRRLTITKVDLCRDGANPDADILLFKSRDHDVAKRDIPASHRHEMSRKDFAGPHESFPIEEPGDVAAAAHLVGHAQDPEAVKRRIIRIARRMGPSFVARLPESWNVKKEDTSVPKPKKIDVTKASEEELKTYAVELEKALESQEKELEKKQTPPPSDDDEEDDEDDMPSSKKKVKKFKKPEIPEDIKKRLDDAEAAVKKANDDAAAAREQVAKAEEKAALADVRKTIETSFNKLPGDLGAVAQMYRSVQKALTADDFKTFEAVLKAGHEAIAKASEEIGSSKGVAIGSAQEEIMRKADEMVEKKIVKTRSEGVERVAKENSELYERYRQEQRDSRRR